MAACSRPRTRAQHRRRAPSPIELTATLILRFPSPRVGQDPHRWAIDEPEDLDLPVWAGVSLRLGSRPAVADAASTRGRDARLRPGLPAMGAVSPTMPTVGHHRSASGIGAACAERLGANGYEVIGIDRHGPPWWPTSEPGRAPIGDRRGRDRCGACSTPVVTCAGLAGAPCGPGRSSSR